MTSARQIDENGYITVNANPISKVGVFPYSGAQLPDADPNKIYYVYRPEEELSSIETLESLKLLPIIDEHEMLGDGYEGEWDNKPRCGTTGEEVFFQNGTIYSKLKIFSTALRNTVQTAKNGLSLGYRCVYEKSSGVFNGMPYDYIQRQIRGNHLAVVTEGRMGTVVLDSNIVFDHVDIALDNGVDDMNEENKKDKAEDAAIAKVMDALNGIAARLNALDESIAEMKKEDDKDNDVQDEDDNKEKKESEAKDEDSDKEDKKDDKKSDGMDAAIVSGLQARIAELEKRDTKAMLADVAERDSLVRSVTPIVGTFDHAEMTANEVAAYALGKLNLKAPVGHEKTALDSYLAGCNAGKANVGFAIDSGFKKTGLLSKRINGAQS